MSSISEFLQKILANNFGLSDAQDNKFGPLNRGGITDLPLLRTLLEIFQKSLTVRFLGSDRPFCLISICKFGSFKNPYIAITSLSEISFRFRRYILLVQTKRVISMNYQICSDNFFLKLCNKFHQTLRSIMFVIKCNNIDY